MIFFVDWYLVIGDDARARVPVFDLSFNNLSSCWCVSLGTDVNPRYVDGVKLWKSFILYSLYVNDDAMTNISFDVLFM